MRLIIYLFLLLPFSVISQDLFLKQFDNPTNSSIGEPKLTTLGDGTLITVNAKNNSLGKRNIMVTSYNPCGDVLWSKMIEHPSKMQLVETQSDQLDNTIIAGYFDESSREPFVISIAPNGSINFFKRYITNTSNLSCLTYSIHISPNNQIFVYINYDISTAGPASRPSILKLNSDGSIVWYKLYDFHSFHYGFMFGTSDGGLLFTMATTFVKIDSLGNVEWMNRFNGRIDPMKGIETPLGYAFSSFDHSSGLPINYLMLNKDGSIKWNIQNFNTFITNSSTLLNNGNLLYLGRDAVSGNNTLLEIDPSNGNQVRFKKLIYPFQNISLSDIIEDKNGNILVSGVTQTAIIPKITIAKLNDTLSLLNCPDSNIIGNYTIDTLITNPLSFPTHFNNTVITSSNEVFTSVDQIITPSSLCSFTKDRGNLELGNDTTLCSSESITLGDPNSNFDGYLWSNGKTSKTITVNNAGQYILSVIVACDTLKDTVQVNYFPKEIIDLGNDTTICYGDTIRLNNISPLPNYRWSNSATTSTIPVFQTGIYWLEMTDQCGTVRDSIEITVTPDLLQPFIGNDTTLCPNEKLVLSARNYPHYLWSTNETTSTITVQDSRLYWVEVSNGCDTLRDSIQITTHPTLNVELNYSPSTIRTRDSVLFSNNTIGAISSNWLVDNRSLNNLDSFYTQFNFPGFYPVSISVESIEGCRFELDKTIEVLPSNYTVPNIYTPNGDGINDCFTPKGNDIISYELTVLNRWGVSLLENSSSCWDGRLKSGEKASDGTYFYQLVIRFIDGTKSYEKGSVYLLR